MAVHARPAAFEGADGRSYTVAIETDEKGERARPIGAYLLFVCWGGEQPAVTGHLETAFLAWGATVDEAVARAGALSLHDVKRELDALTGAGAPKPRPWWDAMRDEGADSDG